MKAPFTFIGTRSLAGNPVRFFTAADTYRLDGGSQPLVAWRDVLIAIGVPIAKRFIVTRLVSNDQRYEVWHEGKRVKAVPAHVALSVVAVWSDVTKRGPAMVAEFIQISADATAIWARSIATEDFAATDIDAATAEYWIAKTAEGAREVETTTLSALIGGTELSRMFA